MRLNRLGGRLLFGSFLWALATIGAASTTCAAQTSVLTANGSNERTNANLAETQLTPDNVAPGSFGKLGTFPVDGQVFTQALYVNALQLGALGVKNVLVVTTMHNSVYAYDADSIASPVLLWHVNLGPAVPSSLLFPKYSDIDPEVGILGTGAVDIQRGVFYVVSENLVAGAPVFYLHALDLTSGEEQLNGPVAITAAISETGAVFDAKQHLQRPALLLANDMVYVAFGAVADQPPWHGWLVSYDASNLSSQTAIFSATPAGAGGGIWQSGRGLAADDQGNVYAISGNGDYDGVQNYSESFLKLDGAALSLLDWFTPSNWVDLDGIDGDLSAGPALITGTHLLAGADKTGALYLLNGDSMGRLGSASGSPPQSISASPIGLIFNLAIWSNADGAYIYTQGQSEGPKCFQATGGVLNPAPLSTGSTPTEYTRVGMTLSANGAQEGTGILWETTANYGNRTSAGTLHAYDASNLASELWNSDMNPGSDSLGTIAKFVNPTVVNGRVYIPTFSNTVVVYGPLPTAGTASVLPQITGVANAASYSRGIISPGEVVTVFGSHLSDVTPAATQLDDSGRVTTSLAGTVVMIGGVQAPVVYASSNQLNAVVPFGLPAGSVQIEVGYQGQMSTPLTVSLMASTPGVFSADGSGRGAGLIFNWDGSANSASNPAAAGSTIVLYVTGTGEISPAAGAGSIAGSDGVAAPLLPVSAQIGGIPAQVDYTGSEAGMLNGIMRVILEVPAGAPAGPAVPVVIQVGDQASQPGLTLAVR